MWPANRGLSFKKRSFIPVEVNNSGVQPLLILLIVLCQPLLKSEKRNLDTGICCYRETVGRLINPEKQLPEMPAAGSE